MHLITKIMIFFGGLFPSRLHDGDEDTEAMHTIQRKNWMHLGGAIIVVLLLTALFWFLTDMFLTGPEHKFKDYNIGDLVFAAAVVTVSYLALDWAFHKTLIPASVMKRIWPKRTEVELTAAEGDYLLATEVLTKRFWAAVEQSGFGGALKKKQGKKAPAPRKEEIEERPDPENEEESVFTRVNRYSSETQTTKLVVNQNKTMLWLAFAGVTLAAIMVAMAFINMAKDMLVIIGWVIAVGIIGAICFVLYKLNTMKGSKKMKLAFNWVYGFIIVAILFLASAWSVQSVRTNLLAFLNIGNTSGLTASLSGAAQGLVPTIELPKNQNTPTPTPTIQGTPAIEEPKIVFAVGEYSLEVKKKTNEDMAGDMSILADSVNSITAEYLKAAQNIKDNNANMAEWSTLCYGEGSISDVSTQNRTFLNVGSTEDGKPVLSYVERLGILKETKAIEPENADQLADLAKLINGILEEHDNLCVPLAEMEAMAKAAGGDYSLVDQTRVAELFAEAKQTAVKINDIAKGFNERKQENMPRLEKLAGPDGQELMDFLEAVYPAAKKDIYVTATPGPTAPSIMNTLLPPTAIPTATPTQDACRAAVTSDEGKSWLGYEWGIEDYLEQLRKAGSMDVEKYVDACVGFVFSFPVDVTGDGVLDWGIMQEIGMKPALNQYTQMGHDQTNFKLVLADDPLWPDGDKDYVYREKDGGVGDIVVRDWPIPVEIQPTATQRATEVSGCRPADTGTYGNWNQVPMRWQELATGFGGDGKAKYHTCLSNLYYITVEIYGNFYWFNQNEAPTGIAQDRYFWVDWYQTPYYWSANPTPTPTPPSAEMCKPARTDVLGDGKKLNITWQQLDDQFPDDGLQDYAWYFRCRPDAIYVIVMISLPGDQFNLYWLNQGDNPSNIAEGQAFWVSGNSASPTTSQFDPPAK